MVPNGIWQKSNIIRIWDIPVEYWNTARMKQVVFKIYVELCEKYTRDVWFASSSSSALWGLSPNLDSNTDKYDRTLVGTTSTCCIWWIVGISTIGSHFWSVIHGDALCVRGAPFDTSCGCGGSTLFCMSRCTIPDIVYKF